MKSLLASLFLALSLSSFASTDFDPPFVGSMGASKKVLGEYPRTQIMDASEFPNRAIGQIEIGCTGTLIGPKHIITAGHCVYDTDTKEWSTELDFYPGRTSETEKPFGAIGWKKVFVQKEYLETGDKEFDFAVIELSEPIGEKLGWIGYRVLQEKEYASKVRITGYPGDKDKGTMWTVTCPSLVEGFAITYKCDTFGGMSGSGVLALNPESDLDTITSVHTWGNNEINGGVILNRHNFDLVKSWKNGTNYSSNTVVHEKEAPKQTFDKFYFLNNCHLPLIAFLHWREIGGEWRTGVWDLEPGEKAYVADTKNRIYYFSAISDDGSQAWEGPTDISFKGRTLHMIKNTITTDTFGDWTQVLNCR